ncbi:MAG: hypothetical protein LBI26_02300 [Holosporales bacterium]|jgi:hypothetical protein|nr:hypothetical protein [Holosporales bacterium]
MKIFQKDLTGAYVEVCADSSKKVREKTVSAARQYRDITVMDGVDEGNAEADAMLIHRILQKKVIYGGFSKEYKKKLLLKILNSEISIKRGEIDSVSATRDSLLSYFGKLGI